MRTAFNCHLNEKYEIKHKKYKSKTAQVRLLDVCLRSGI